MLGQCLRAAACALLCVLAPRAEARPFTVDDLLHQESLGAVALDPSGRWLVFEQRGPYDSAPRFDQHFATSRTLGRLQVADLRDAEPARPLLAQDAGPGVVMGPFSPQGERVAVYRLHEHRWSLGVVTLATGEANWFDLTPQETGRGRSLQWLSEDHFLVIERLDGLPPEDARDGWLAPARLTAAWAAAARGDGAHTVLGSGAYAGLRARGPPKRLLRVDARTGARMLLAEGEFIDLEVSPDGQRVALFQSGPDVQPQPDGPVRGPAGLETEATQLVVLDLTSGARTTPACTACDFLPNLLAWSPRGRSLLTYVRGDDGLWTSGHLMRVNPLTGLATPVGIGLQAQARLNPVTIRAGWMGEDPVISARRVGDPQGRSDWYRLGPAGPVNLSRRLVGEAGTLVGVDVRGLTVIAGGRLLRMDGRGHPGPILAEEAALALPQWRGAEGSRLVNGLPPGSWITLGHDGRRWLAWASATTVTAPIVAVPQSGAQIVAASASAHAAVMREIDPQGVETLAVQLSDRPARTLVTINRGLAETDALRVSPIRHTGAMGEPLTSWLFRPTAPTGGAPPPLIVRPYLGSSASSRTRDLYMEQGFFQNLRLLTAHGYAVLVPSLPNPPGGMTDPMDRVAERILAVVSAAQAQPDLAGAFDPDRLALMGWSFGGYTTMAAITQTDRFRAAVAMDGISDLVSYWDTITLMRSLVPEEGYGSIGATGTVESTQPALGAPPWKDPDRYHRNSPILAADRINTPLLLIHGGLDPIPMAGSQAMYSALFRQNKDAILVIYWGADHAVTSPGDVRDVYARTFDFLDEHLRLRNGPSARLSSRPEPVSANDGPRPQPRPH